MLAGMFFAVLTDFHIHDLKIMGNDLIKATSTGCKENSFRYRAHRGRCRICGCAEAGPIGRSAEGIQGA